MISIALLVVAGALYAFATYWRERSVPEDGVARPDRLVTLLNIEAACGMVAAVALPMVHMVVFVS